MLASEALTLNELAVSWRRRMAAVQQTFDFIPTPNAKFDSAFAGVERLELGRGAWVEVQQQWLTGSKLLFDALCGDTEWAAHNRWMYERRVSVPRLIGAPSSGTSALPLLQALSAALSRRYGRALNFVSMAFYRDGRDSVAMHGDKLGVLRTDTVVAIVSLGEPRRFLMKPNEPLPANGLRVPARFVVGPNTLGFRLGWGDLLVMGGSCQATWQHGVPKVAHAGPRMSVMFRQGLDEVEVDDGAASFRL